MTILANLLELLVVCLAGAGPILLLAVLLNRRDRRATVLLNAVAAELPSDAMRSDVAVDVRCRLLTRGATVRVDLGSLPWPRVWDVAARLRRTLPSAVRLEVDGRVDGLHPVPRPVHITVESPEPATLGRAA